MTQADEDVPVAMQMSAGDTTRPVIWLDEDEFPNCPECGIRMEQDEEPLPPSEWLNWGSEPVWRATCPTHGDWRIGF